MLVEATLGNLYESDAAATDEAAIDWLDLTWDQCLRRATSSTTRSGQAVRILLRLGSPWLRHGDVLHRSVGSETPTIAIHLLPCAILIAQPATESQRTSLIYALGDLHVPMQIHAGQIIAIEDGPVIGVLDRLEIPYRTAIGRFEPTHGSSSALFPSLPRCRSFEPQAVPQD